MSTHIALILDKSGSMSVATQETKDSVVSYVKKVRKQITDAFFTLTAFNTKSETWVESQPLNEVKINSVLDKYIPTGSTALYDAVGSTIKKVRKVVGEQDKALVVIITDGQENSSVEYDRKKLNKLINKLTDKGNWTFIFLGANVDSWAEANKIGIAPGNVGQYTYGKGQFRSSDSLVHSTVALSASPNFSTETAFADAGQTQDFTENSEKANVKSRSK
jgi:hypothetical protein